MYFKLELTLNPLFITIREEEPVTLAISDNQNTAVSISVLDGGERQRYRPGSLTCTAVTQRVAPPDIQDIFARLAENLMPRDYKPSKEQIDIDRIDACGI